MSTTLQPAALTSENSHGSGNLTPTTLAEMVRSFAARPELWAAQVQFTEPERFYTRLEVTDAHEVWLLTWLPGQGTEIHDHGGASGAFTVVRGALTERTFPRSPHPVHTTPWELPTESIRAFGPRHTHRVTNLSVEPAVSIHAYSPALAAMSYYRQLDDGSVELVRTEGVDR
ncbi:cysteine dioxygenase family protein [Streptomyces sp. XM4193]|uniref:cysteine dioxygenase n=1 Tax=Streptomyces sp. XM4193 TaxID=2929782 RepID=UPI001FFBFF37|nr:cysteine dioxygenase family protein [Streptomyces sp. XM4193]MCK1797108.1 cysteine dioxygenase family protein [Streptomyces sp. XM4193]